MNLATSLVNSFISDGENNGMCFLNLSVEERNFLAILHNYGASTVKKDDLVRILEAGRLDVVGENDVKGNGEYVVSSSVLSDLRQITELSIDHLVKALCLVCIRDSFC